MGIGAGEEQEPRLQSPVVMWESLWSLEIGVTEGEHRAFQIKSLRAIKHNFKVIIFEKYQ
jgi:hypothetical protein